VLQNTGIPKYNIVVMTTIFIKGLKMDKLLAKNMVLKRLKA
jgi:hypothetical protein